MQSSAQSMEKITCSPTRNHLYHEPNGGSLRGEAGEGRGGGEKRKREKGKRAFPSLINNLFHSSLSLTDDACHILSPSV